MVEKIDAIVMAGDRGPSRRFIRGRHKAFLEVKGSPIISHVISALEESRHVRRIFVVGPKKELEGVLFSNRDPAGVEGRIYILNQWESFVANAWNGFLVTIFDGAIPDCVDDDMLRPYTERAVLYVSCDMPLLTHQEVDEFLQNCDMEKYDYILGITPEHSLKPFYPRSGLPGIKLAYFHLKEGRFRHNNMHCVKPLKITNRIYIQKMYEYRWQRRWDKVIKAAWEVVKLTWNARVVGYFFSMHIARILGQWGLREIPFFSPFFLPKAEVERRASALLGARFGTVETYYGGAALDVDDEYQYEVIKLNFDLWRRFLEKPARSRMSSKKF